MSDLSEDLAAHLAADGALALTVGANLFRSPPRAPTAIQGPGGVPSACAFLWADGGREPQRYMGSARGALEFLSVSVVYRGGARAFELEEGKAHAMLRRLELAPVPGYVSVRVLQSAPEFLGWDEADLPRWRFFVEAWRAR